MTVMKEGSTSKSGFWIKLQSIALTIVAIMLSLGQWNDTKDALSSAYEGFVTHWTNQIEYKQISQLHVGQTQEYVKNIIGIPQASKVSKIDSEITFYYYSNKKYQLTLAIKRHRLSGYSVVALNTDFFAPIPFINKTLFEGSLGELYSKPESYYTDARNLKYFSEPHELGKNAMFYQLLLGSVDYGHFSEVDIATLTALNEQLDKGKDASKELAMARILKPNYFAVTELTSELMNEGLLTHFEYKTLLKK